jgi:hypothetical protein
MEIIDANNEETKINVLDNPGEGNACHNYIISKIDNNDEDIFCKINFQNGPIKENGVNGCQNEDLLSIVIHRLDGFQAGEFRCRENAIALTKIQEALHWLNHRTTDRKNRNVEGTNKK